jgi:hypothetical protein
MVKSSNFLKFESLETIYFRMLCVCHNELVHSKGFDRAGRIINET